jgi:hypothetical protein
MLFDAQHTFAYSAAMPLIQVRDVPEATVTALKARAAERGLTLTSYLRGSTLRCLTDDLGLKSPPINDPLDNPLLRKANQQWCCGKSAR